MRPHHLLLPLLLHLFCMCSFSKVEVDKSICLHLDRGGSCSSGSTDRFSSLCMCMISPASWPCSLQLQQDLCKVFVPGST